MGRRTGNGWRGGGDDTVEMCLKLFVGPLYRAIILEVRLRVVSEFGRIKILFLLNFVYLKV